MNTTTSSTHTPHTAETPQQATQQGNSLKSTLSGFSIGELEWFKVGVSFGYLALAIGSFLAMSFFITHNMVGTNKPLWDTGNGFNWTLGQGLYLLVSLGFAFGFNAFTWFFYQIEQSVKNKGFVLMVAIVFPLFCEVGQSMTRAEETRHESATESETFKTMQKRVENAGTGNNTGLASLIADAEADKAKAQTASEQCTTRFKTQESQGKCQRQQEQATAQAQGRIQSLRQSGVEQINTTSEQLAKDSQTLKELEHDTTFLQPIVRLLMGLGFPALLASFTIALVIIGSIEVAMSYLGGLLRQIKEALRAKGREPTPKQAHFQSPFVSALHATGEVIAGEMAKAQYAQEQLRRKVTGESPRPPLSVPPALKPKQETPKAKPESQTEEKTAEKTETKPDELPKGASQKEAKDALRVLVRLVTHNRDSSTPFTLEEIKRAYAVAKTFQAMPVMDLEKITLAFNNLKERKKYPQDIMRSEPSAEGMMKNQAENQLLPSAEGTEGSNPQQPSAEGLEQAYGEWLTLVRAGQVKPTIKPSVRWISSRELVKGIKEIETLAYDWLERAKREGVITDNPEKGSGKPLYVLVK